MPPTSMIKDKKCERSNREGGFPFDFRTLQNRERGGGGGGGYFFGQTSQVFEQKWDISPIELEISNFLSLFFGRV